MERKEIKGIEEVRWYDITDYEGFHDGNRRAKSPMMSFCYLDESNLAEKSTKDFYKSDFFKNWLTIKRHNCFIFIILWCLLRLWNVALFFAFDIGVFYPENGIEINVHNSSTNTTEVMTVDADYITPCRGNLIKSTTVQCLFLFCLLIQNSLKMIFDIGEFVYLGIKHWKKQVWFRWTEKGKKKLAVQSIFYRILQFGAEFGISFGTLFGLHLSLTGQTMIKNTMVIKMMYLLIANGLIWSLLYFVQLNPWLGKMVVSIQRMIHDLLRFFVVYALMLIMFAYAFLRLISEGTNVTGKCSDKFATVLDSWYR